MLVRAHDPVTSMEAAEHAVMFSGPHCDRIEAALAELGQATAWELTHATGLTVVQIDRRLPELARAGRARVVQSGGDDVCRNGYRVWEVA
ncbi:hypothetical protein CCO03_17085 [Comamonas serinivorans]|uniref:ArsR family transcriptional regulator n=1 Tax=Comamonas serinivorans TaxID=1082851 RepID=A0A1Y0ERZ4_9BURK|nr:hypothetical protein CCO03_17085 [Comamonas serinivorans]